MAPLSLPFPLQTVTSAGPVSIAAGLPRLTSASTLCLSPAPRISVATCSPLYSQPPNDNLRLHNARGCGAFPDHHGTFCNDTIQMRAVEKERVAAIVRIHGRVPRRPEPATVFPSYATLSGPSYLPSLITSSKYKLEEVGGGDTSGSAWVYHQFATGATTSP